MRYNTIYFRLLRLSQVTVIGRFQPRLKIDWPALTITHTLLGDTVRWSPMLALTYMQAYKIRNALKQDPVSMKPLFYAHRRGDTAPTPIVVWSGNNQNVPTPLDTEQPSAPDEHGQQPIRLYPVM